MLKKIINQKNILEIIIFSFIAISFNVHPIFDYVLVLALVVVLIKSDIMEVLHAFIYFSFFDDVLQFDILGGSISRIIMVVMFSRGVFYFVKYKIAITKKESIICGFLVLSLITGVITKNFSFGDVIVCVNIGLIILYSLIGRQEIQDINEELKNIFIHILTAVMTAVIYGIFRGNFLFEKTGSLEVYRFSGTYEPNFMGMYINMAIIIILFAPKIKKAIRYSLLAFLIGMLGMTLSMSGIAICTFILIFYIFSQKTDFLRKFLEIGVIGILAIVIFVLGQYSFTVVNHITLNSQKVEEMTSVETFDKEEPMNPSENVADSKEIGEVQGNDIEENSDAVEPMVPKENSTEAEGTVTVDEVVEKNFLIQRLESLWSELKQGDFDTLTSGRLPIFRSFVEASFDRSALEIFFGNGLQDEQVYCDFFGKEKEAHNSYINCLYNFGIIGFIIIGIGLFKVIKSPQIFGQKIKFSLYKDTFVVMQWMFLLYALVLSLYTKRMFLIFFIL